MACNSSPCLSSKADLNRELVIASFRKTPFLAQMPEVELERVVRYPESDVCRR